MPEAACVNRDLPKVPLTGKIRSLSVSVYTLDPLEDARWEEFIQAHPAASVFHSRGWLQALSRTYDYRPVVYTTNPPGADLINGILVCRISSWLTGRRMVALPFSDHCEPLVDYRDDRIELLGALEAAVRTEQLRYVELRAKTSDPWKALRIESGTSYWFHTLDLRPPLEVLFRNAHRNTIRRSVQRAIREQVTYEEGPAESLLPEFYRLLLLTRRRHGIPPQPLRWFTNLITCLKDRVAIRLALWRGVAIGGMLTLRHRDTLVYKYGCSDSRYHHLGTMPFLFWRCIEEAKAAGVQTFDLGRSDLSGSGLIQFKERLGGQPSMVTYFRQSRTPRTTQSQRSPLRPLRLPSWVLAGVPDALFIQAGKVMYRHIG